MSGLARAEHVFGRRLGNTKREQAEGGPSMFLESVRQEMPSAHLELLYSGSVRVTAEAFEVWLK